jgi:hypothetical protein
MTVTAAEEDAAEQQEHEDAPTNKKWIHSLAKKSLRTDIILRKVTANCNPKDVYDMHNSYKGFPFDNFKKNLQSLIEAVAKDIARMQHGGPQNSLGIRSHLCGSPGSIALGSQQLILRCWSFVPDILVDILGLFSALHGINVRKYIEPPLIVGQDDNQ